MEVIFIVIGYHHSDDQGRMHESCQIEVYAKNEAEAIEKAKAYIEKEFYKVTSIIEKVETKCTHQE